MSFFSHFLFRSLSFRPEADFMFLGSMIIISFSKLSRHCPMRSRGRKCIFGNASGSPRMLFYFGWTKSENWSD